MSDRQLFRALVAVCRRAGIRVLYGRPRTRGGACSYRGRNIVVIHKDSDFEQRAWVLAECLAELDLDSADLETDAVRRAVAAAKAAFATTTGQPWGSAAQLELNT